MRKLSIILIAIVVAVLLGYFGYVRLTGAGSRYKAPAAGKVHVVATTYPLGEFARNIGGEYVFVTVATPTGVEPHDFEPTAQQVAFMTDADVFVMNGGGIDAWANDVATQVLQRGGKVVNISETPGLTDNDPHIWLDPQLAQDVVRYIRYAIIDKDPAHRDEYLSMTDAYLTKLLETHQAYESGLRECTLRDVIVAHDAFGYIGRRYNVHIHSILGLSPEEEPSVKDIADLAELAKELNIKTIFFETLVPSKLAKTLADEVDAQTAVLNPIEGLTRMQSIQGENYLSLMEENLQALRAAMMCQ